MSFLLKDRANSTFNKGLRKSKKIKPKQEKIKTTLTAKHNELMQQMDDEIRSIPELESKVEDLQHELSVLESQSMCNLTQQQIDRRFQITEEIQNLKQKIKEIPQKRTNYFLQNGRLIFDYNELNNSGAGSKSKFIRNVSINDIFTKKKVVLDDTSNKDLKSKADCLKKFLSNVDPNYVDVSETPINEDNFCEKCQCFRILKPNEAKMVCQKCGTDISIIMESDKPSLKDPPPEARHYEYKRYNHFCEWLAKIQGKESSEIPDEVIDMVWVEIKRKRITDLRELDEDNIKAFLKKYNYADYFNNATQILFQINGIPPIQMTPEQERHYKQMFLTIQDPYERHRPDSRSNFSSYSYIIYRFSQLLGYKDIMAKMKHLKSKEKRHALDMIWKKICTDLGGKEKGWVYIRS